MSEATARHALPLIQPGQAQKEVAHNEALALLDLLAHPVVVAVGLNAPPAEPTPGECWVVGVAPSGAWSGHAHALAGWTDGGWRFVAPRLGLTVETRGGGFARWNGTGWVAGEMTGMTLRLAGQQVVGAQRPAIPDLAGGGTIDSEARAAIGALLTALRGHGLIAGA